MSLGLVYMSGASVTRSMPPARHTRLTNSEHTKSAGGASGSASPWRGRPRPGARAPQHQPPEIAHQLGQRVALAEQALGGANHVRARQVLVGRPQLDLA